MARTIRNADGTWTRRSRALPVRHAGSPLQTNASLNRDAATKAFKAGVTAEQIADYWPEVFYLDPDGKLSQKYDYELADGSGRKETNRRITDDSVESCIASYVLKGSR